MSSKCAVFPDTEVFKGRRFALNKIFDVQSHFKATETLRRVSSNERHYAFANELESYKTHTKPESYKRVFQANPVYSNEATHES